MSVRKPALDPSTAELARRRLSQLGAELSASATTTASTAPAPATEPAVARPAMRPRAGRHAGARLSLAGRVVARAGDALPAGLQGRIGVTAQHVTVVALVLAAAMALAAWLVLRSVPEPAPAPRQASLRLPPTPLAPTPLAPVAAPALPASPEASAAAVVVHVTGKVRRPGVVELPGGSRVFDAIEEAGGARPGVRLGALNLARLVVDGEQIAVGVPAAVVTPPVSTVAPLDAAASGVPGVLVDLNTATQLQLEELPGVGPVTATSIIEWRTEHGGFTTVDELLEVSGIGEVTLAELRDLVTV